MTPTRRKRIGAKLALLTLLGAATLAAAATTGRGAPPPPPPAPATASPVVPADAARIEVAFVLDATGSMSGLLEGAKRRIWALADEMAGPGRQARVRLGLVGYRDRGDDFVTRVHPFTEDMDAFSAALASLQAGGGGDTPESVNQALNEAVTRLAWSAEAGVYRVIFLVGDAPPHTDYPGDVPWEQSVRLAAQRGIRLNTIQCGELQQTRPVFEAMARLGEGRYAAIAQDGGMLALASPMDDELARLNRELAATVLPYGSAAERRTLGEKVARSLEAPASAAADRLAYLGGRVAAGARDLVEALEAGEVDLDALPEEALPEPLRAAPKAEREVLVDARRRARSALNARIAELGAERESWLRQEAERRGDAAGSAFDAVVLDAVRAQAAEVGIDLGDGR